VAAAGTTMAREEDDKILHDVVSMFSRPGLPGESDETEPSGGDR
jgi:hypothetical protein